MNLADVFTVVLVILALLAVFVATWLLTAGLSPRLAERCAERLGGSPWACAAAGLGVLVPVIAAAILIGRASPNAAGRLLVALALLGTLLAALAGSTGLALRIGRGLPSAGDADAPWHAVRRGGVVLALTFLTIVMIPLTLVPGLGALVLARGRPADQPPAA